MYERAKKHKEFSESLRICKQIQKAILIEMSLCGIYNSKIAELMLKNNHNFVDKKEVDHTTKGQSIKGILLGIQDVNEQEETEDGPGAVDGKATGS